MNTFQLRDELERNSITKPFFDGIFSYDTLCLIKTKPRLIICNTDHSKSAGKHWLTFFFPEEEPDVGEMFDSLGKNLNEYPQEIVQFFRRFCKRCRIARIPVQSVNSQLSCAEFCLYFAYRKCVGHSFQRIMSDKLSSFSSSSRD